MSLTLKRQVDFKFNKHLDELLKKSSSIRWGVANTCTCCGTCSWVTPACRTKANTCTVFMFLCVFVCFIAGMPREVWGKLARDRQLPYGKIYARTNTHARTNTQTHLRNCRTLTKARGWRGMKFRPTHSFSGMFLRYCDPLISTILNTDTHPHTRTHTLCDLTLWRFICLTGASERVCLIQTTWSLADVYARYPPDTCTYLKVVARMHVRTHACTHAHTQTACV